MSGQGANLLLCFPWGGAARGVGWDAVWAALRAWWADPAPPWWAAVGGSSIEGVEGRLGTSGGGGLGVVGAEAVKG